MDANFSIKFIYSIQYMFAIINVFHFLFSVFQVVYSVSHDVVFLKLNNSGGGVNRTRVTNIITQGFSLCYFTPPNKPTTNKAQFTLLIVGFKPPFFTSWNTLLCMCYLFSLCVPCGFTPLVSVLVSCFFCKVHDRVFDG